MKTTTLRILLVSTATVLLGAGCNTPTKPVINKEIIPVQQVTSTEPAPKTTQTEKVGYNMADRAHWYKQLKWPASCEKTFTGNLGDSTNTEESDGGLAFYRVDEKTNLVRITCDRFAYQESMIFMLAKLDKNGTVISTKLLKLPIYSYKEKKVIPTMLPEVLGTDSFDTQTKTLRILVKDRGVGDCGGWLKYAIVQNGVHLREERKLSCDDAEAFYKNKKNAEPSSWPVLYQLSNR